MRWVVVFGALGVAWLIPDDAPAGWRGVQAACWLVGFAGGLAWLKSYSSFSGLKNRASLRSSTYVSWWKRMSSPMKPR